VKKYDASVDQQAQSKDEFKIIPMGRECGALLPSDDQVDHARGGGFTLDVASDLLLDLYSVDHDLELGQYRDIYVSRSWHEFPESELLLANACEFSEIWFRWWATHPDQQGFDKNTRVKDIISSAVV
jgi:hypothetical protein